MNDMTQSNAADFLATLTKVPALIKKVEELEEKLEYYQSLQLKNWYRRAETLKILDMTDPTLLSIANEETTYKSGMIRRTFEGHKPMYYRGDIEKYLEKRKHVTKPQVRERILKAVQG